MEESLPHRSVQEQILLNRSLNEILIQRDPIKLATALENGAMASNTRHTLKQSPLLRAIRSNNLPAIDMLWLAEAHLSSTEDHFIKRLTKIHSTTEFEIPKYLAPFKEEMHEVFEKSKAALRKEEDVALRGMRRFYELLEGATVTPQTIREDYGIAFNLDVHINNVEKSPLKTSAAPLPEWAPPEPADEVYSDIETLANISVNTRNSKKITAAEKAVINFDMDEHLEKTRPSSKLNGDRKQLQTTRIQEDPSLGI
jgi:hypothetical protein